MNHYLVVIARLQKDEYLDKLKILAAHIIIKNDNEINPNSNVYKSTDAKLTLNESSKVNLF